MCLLAIAYREHPDIPLIVAGNRDEFHARPSADARWWADRPEILGGRDLQAGGTWLALSAGGRFASVTNFRDAVPPSPKLASRGSLVTDFIDASTTAVDFVRSLSGDRYGAFNLIVSDGSELAYARNRDADQRALPAGIYGIANAALDTPWPKVVRTKDALRALIDADRVNETSLFKLLSDRERAPAAEVDAGELPFDKAHALTAPFVVMPEYGTRCSTVVLFGADGSVRFAEQRFDAAGNVTGRSEFRFRITQPTP